ncbi:hypothetical protein [Nonomuraea sp. SYSU D8015]|uniref:hypothetical protein n=1 Tax=Nonomuraea sp. SYSU D8015 TaxID=2593644 RepID=UPI001661247E|nr:hypothetical protein [Nonomuraea sp. SYSU D8015]
MDSLPKGTTRPMARTPLTTALLYASLGWPIAAGAHITASGCSCGDTLCGTPGRHPHWQQAPSTDPVVLRMRWVLHPHATVLAQIGVAFDIMHISEDDGRRLLGAWDQAKMPPGAPMLYADNDLLVLTRPEQPAGTADTWLALPVPTVRPSGPPKASWVVPATPVNAATLPSAQEVRRLLNGGMPSPREQQGQLQPLRAALRTRPTASYAASGGMGTPGSDREIR